MMRLSASTSSSVSPCDGMTVTASLTADMRVGNSAQLVGSDKCSVPTKTPGFRNSFYCIFL